MNDDSRSVSGLLLDCAYRLSLQRVRVVQRVPLPTQLVGALHTIGLDVFVLRALAFQPLWGAEPPCGVPDSSELKASTAAHGFQVRYESLRMYTKLHQVLAQCPSAQHGSRYVHARLPSAPTQSGSLPPKHASGARTGKRESSLTAGGQLSCSTATGGESGESLIVPLNVWARRLVEFMAVSVGLVPRLEAPLIGRRMMDDGHLATARTAEKEAECGTLASLMGNALADTAETTRGLPVRSEIDPRLDLEELTQFLISIQTLKPLLGENFGHEDNAKDFSDACVLADGVHARVRRSLQRALGCSRPGGVEVSKEECLGERAHPISVAGNAQRVEVRFWVTVVSYGARARGGKPSQRCTPTEMQPNSV